MNVKRVLVFPAAVLLAAVVGPPPAAAQGNFEFSFHLGTWNVNFLRGVIEEGVGEALDRQLRDEFLKDIQADFPGLAESSYSQEVIFDSRGNGWGFELRWYPGGHDGSFSLGLIVERMTMAVGLPTVSADLRVIDRNSGRSGRLRSAADAEFLIKPLAFLLAFRWDLVPSWRVNPYITLGFGAAGGRSLENSRLSFGYTADLSLSSGESESYEDSLSKTLKEVREDLENDGEDFFIPGFFPFLQLNVGLKAKIVRNLHVLADVGILNGFAVRGGVAIRL